jgi:hypothetical protein
MLNQTVRMQIDINLYFYLFECGFYLWVKIYNLLLKVNKHIGCMANCQYQFVS